MSQSDTIEIVNKQTTTCKQRSCGVASCSFDQGSRHVYSLFLLLLKPTHPPSLILKIPISAVHSQLKKICEINFHGIEKFKKIFHKY